MSPTATQEVDPHERLRAPFPTSSIGKLPRVSCGACRQAIKENKKGCPNHPPKDCPVCKNWMTPSHIHLDYIGHAAVTSRILSVDPAWEWRPATREELDVLPPPGPDGMWIALKILGHERFGYGDSEGKKGADAVKARLSDAIKNAAMRFGVGLDLWSKEELEDPNTAPGPDSAPSEGAPEPNPTANQRNWAKDLEDAKTAQQVLDLGTAAAAAEVLNGQLKTKFTTKLRRLQTEEKAAQEARESPAEVTG